MSDLTQAGSLLERTRRLARKEARAPRSSEVEGYMLLMELHDRIVELTPPASHNGYTQLEWEQMNRLDRFALLHSELMECLQRWPGPDSDRHATPSVLVELAEFIHHCPLECPQPGNERYAELRETLREKTQDIHGNW